MDTVDATTTAADPVDLVATAVATDTAVVVAEVATTVIVTATTTEEVDTAADVMITTVAHTLAATVMSTLPADTVVAPLLVRIATVVPRASPAVVLTLMAPLLLLTLPLVVVTATKIGMPVAEVVLLTSRLCCQEVFLSAHSPHETRTLEDCMTASSTCIRLSFSPSCTPSSCCRCTKIRVSGCSGICTAR